MLRRIFTKMVDGFIYGTGFCFFSALILLVGWFILDGHFLTNIKQKLSVIPIAETVINKTDGERESIHSYILKEFNAPRIPIPDDYRIVEVASVVDFDNALNDANNNGGMVAIVMLPGNYEFPRARNIVADNIMILSKFGNPYEVILSGGQDNLLRVSASHFYIDGVTLSRAANHLIQIAGESEASYTKINNCILKDAYEQLLKVSYNKAQTAKKSKHGVVSNSVFQFTTGKAFQYYTGGIDALGAENWLVIDNIFKDIASPAQSISQHAVHFWFNSRNNQIINNLFIDVDRAIGLGMPMEVNKSALEYSHKNGLISGNVIFHSEDSGIFADVGIILESNENTKVSNNFIFMQHSYPNAIEYRFENSRDINVFNNSVNKDITSRDNASAELSGNLVNLSQLEFVNKMNDTLERLGVINLNEPIE